MRGTLLRILAQGTPILFTAPAAAMAQGDAPVAAAEPAEHALVSGGEI